jgi:hypothetical protein
MNGELTVYPVKRVRDADGASCRDCGTVFGTAWFEPVPWDWRRSQAMHEKGTGHHMQLFSLRQPAL